MLGAKPLAGFDVCSIELWVRPSFTDGSGTLLAFYGKAGIQGLSLHQSESDLRVDFEEAPGSRAGYYVGDVFRSGRLVFLAVVSDPARTVVYMNGAAIRRLPGSDRQGKICTGRFVVGDSPTENNTWRGELAGLAIYKDSLTSESVMADYRWWARRGTPAMTGAKTADVLYLFDERKDDRIPDRGRAGIDLSIPARYMIAEQTFLEAPWRAFEPTFGYAEDALINVGGFIPFGLTLSALLKSWGRTRGDGIITVLIGLLVSLTIETLQSKLPTRNSDLTDVLTNTIGAAIGFTLYKNSYGLVAGAIRLVRAPKSV